MTLGLGNGLRRYNLEFLGLCPALVDVEIIDSKNRGKGQLVSVGPMGCTCHSAHARPGSLPPQAPLHAPARLPATHHSVGHPSHWVAPSPRSLAPLGVGMPPLGAAPALSQRLRERSSLFEDVGAGGRGAAEAERAERGEAEERRRGHASTKEEGSLFDALVIAATGSADGAQGEGGEEGEERENGQGRGAEVGGERCGRGEGLPRREDGDSKPVEQGTGKRSREGAEEEGAKRARAGEGGDGWDARGAEVWVAEVFRLRAALHSTEMQLAEVRGTDS